MPNSLAQMRGDGPRGRGGTMNLYDCELGLSAYTHARDKAGLAPAEPAEPAHTHRHAAAAPRGARGRHHDLRRQRSGAAPAVDRAHLPRGARPPPLHLLLQLLHVLDRSPPVRGRGLGASHPLCYTPTKSDGPCVRLSPRCSQLAHARRGRSVAASARQGSEAAVADGDQEARADGEPALRGARSALTRGRRRAAGRAQPKRVRGVTRGVAVRRTTRRRSTCSTAPRSCPSSTRRASRGYALYARSRRPLVSRLNAPSLRPHTLLST
eukprot:2581410-Prymnesium_polylepis.1